MQADEFKAKGVDDIMCVSINDPFTMKAWAEKMGVDGSKVGLFAVVGLSKDEQHGERKTNMRYIRCLALQSHRIHRKNGYLHLTRCVVTQVSFFADVDGSWTRSLGKYFTSFRTMVYR